LQKILIAKMKTNNYIPGYLLGSVRGLKSAFCSYQLKTNLKTNNDCLFEPPIGQWFRSPGNSSSVSHLAVVVGVSGGVFVSIAKKRGFVHHLGSKWIGNR